MKKQFSQDELAAKQVELELDMKTAGYSRFEASGNRAIDSGEASAASWNRRIISQMVEPFALAIDAYKDHYKGRRGKPSKTLTFLDHIDSKQAAYVAMKVIFDQLAGETSLTKLTLAIGNRIEDQVRFSRVADAAPKYIERVKKSLQKSNTASYKHKHIKMVVAETSLTKDNTVKPWNNWPDPAKVQLGARLLDIFQENVLFEGAPLLETKTIKKAKSREVLIRPSERVLEWIEQFKVIVGEASPDFGPCVIPPRPWVTPFEGGYHVQEVANTKPLVKTQKRSHARKLTKDRMPVVYEAVNALQEVRWQINDRVLEVAQEVMSLGLALGMPQREPYQNIEFPFVTELRGRELRESLSEKDLDILNNWTSQQASIYDKERKRRSQFLEINRVLGLAKKYQPYEAIHFVYWLDFRGRIYTSGTTISPQGGDLGKSLIKFADGEPLGGRGKHWLAIQGANVYGEDKTSFDDRAQWVEDNNDMILDIACDPFTYTEWTEADKPWQFLSFCMEWAELQEHIDSGLPCETFISYLPIAQDGSCSGIQHYSAMLRDSRGGAAVNLTASSVPSDIYGEVASLVRLKLSQDDDKETVVLSQKWLTSKDDKNLANRDLCKKPVMTLPYGSTPSTCLESVKDYLDDKGSWYDFKEDRAKAEVHASSVIWSSIGEVVVAAREGMQFIRKLAGHVAKENQPMVWSTPTGFIVHQMAFKMKEIQVDTQLMGRTRISLAERTHEADAHKMQSSSAPNFVHSMDASHLTLATVAFKDAGIDSIAVIHDSFGTHAGKTDKLRKVLIKSFVDMYQEHDVLENLLVDCEISSGKEVDIQRPEKGDLDLNLVNESLYVFG